MWKQSGGRLSSGLSRCVWVACLVSLRGSLGEGVNCSCHTVVFGGAACEKRRVPQVLVDPDVVQRGQLCVMM